MVACSVFMWLGVGVVCGHISQSIALVQSHNDFLAGRYFHSHKQNLIFFKMGLFAEFESFKFFWFFLSGFF